LAVQVVVAPHHLAVLVPQPVHHRLFRHVALRARRAEEVPERVQPPVGEPLSPAATGKVSASGARTSAVLEPRRLGSANERGMHLRPLWRVSARNLGRRGRGWGATPGAWAAGTGEATWGRLGNRRPGRPNERCMHTFAYYGAFPPEV
jgi:hypothetical protein